MSGFPNDQSNPAGAIPVYSAVFDSTGALVAIDSMAKAYTYTEAGSVDTITATDYNGNQWVQTFTYDGNNVSAQSAWVPAS